MRFTLHLSLLLMIPLAGCVSTQDEARPETGTFVAGTDGLYYETLGDGYPVVLIGGGSGMDLRQWDGVFARFAQSFHAIRYDPRGVGRSDNPTEPYSDADDLAALIEHLGYKRVGVIGVSSAGGLALEFAVTHPGRIAAVVAAAPFVPGFAFDDGMTKRLQGFSRAAQRGREPFLDAMFGDPHFMPAPLVPGARAVARGNMGQNLDKAATFDPSLARGASPPLIERLGELRVPVLLLIGELEHPEIQRRNQFLLREIAGSVEHRVAGAGHNTPLENSDAFVESAHLFLTGILPAVR